MTNKVVRLPNKFASRVVRNSTEHIVHIGNSTSYISLTDKYFTLIPLYFTFNRGRALDTGYRIYKNLPYNLLFSVYNILLFDYENNLPKKLLRFSFIASFTVIISSDTTLFVSMLTIGISWKATFSRFSFITSIMKSI